ncbi:hypothetical protein CMQ_4171 [Grosmannia clavigera kw1407]|uniref:NACHT domain-containing protein n=1 Tax=Grosmannia clavigera (strain kw1407 / UAMH 11150) TaxID=655863 RepID=F0X9J8_GROCL|nr:uncharacterized protein CMQ_4171 [Grosmannia clavigera kw1407]EFX06102.1 hypothetical protein CMQ_4171 [Grosmannia clavigera kw1407]
MEILDKSKLKNAGTTKRLVEAAKRKEKHDLDETRTTVLKWLNPVMATQDKYDARVEDNVDGSVEPEPSQSTLKTSLISLLRENPETILVLDGLDEFQTTDRKTFITRVISAPIPHARCIVLSRLSNDVVQSFAEAIPGELYERIHISPANTAEDMRKFSVREITHLSASDISLQRW